MNAITGQVPHTSESHPARNITEWDVVALTRWGSYVTEVEARAVLRAHALAGPTRMAVDVGCGGGRWSKVLSDLGWHLTCIDADPHALEICRNRVPAAGCILAEETSSVLPCASRSASLMLCIEVSNVITADWFFAEARRVLEDRGFLVGTVWNRRSLRSMMSGLRLRQPGKPRMQQYYRSSYRQWRTKLRAAGFRLIYEEGFCWGPFSRASNSALVPLFTDLERSLRLNRLVSLSPWISFIARKDHPG